MLFTVFDVAAVCVGRDRSAEPCWRVVIDRTVRNEADVVLDEVPVLAVLPRIEFNAEAGLKPLNPNAPPVCPRAFVPTS